MPKIKKVAYQSQFEIGLFSTPNVRKVPYGFANTPELCALVNQTRFGKIIEKSGCALRSKFRKAAALLSFTAMATVASPAYSDATNLAEVASGCKERHAVILVGGYGHDWRYFEPWVEQLVAQDACVFGFTSDHTQEIMSKTSRELSEALLSLQTRNFSRTTILAHSMGGLIARRALGEVQSGKFNAPIVLHTYGTPWGGFFWANLSRWTPFGEWLMRTLRVPMSTEIGTSAEFMLSLRGPMPEGVRLVVHHSADDHTASPQTEEARESFAWALGVASEVRTYQEIGHSDYVQMPVGSL